MKRESLSSLGFLPPESDCAGLVVREVDLTAGPAAPFKASFFTVSPGATTPLDRHEVREMWVVLSGRGQLIFQGRKKIRISPRDAFLFDSLETHQVLNDGPEPLHIYSTWWSPEVSQQHRRIG